MVFPPRVGAQIICYIVHWISNLQDPLYLLFGLLIYPDLYSILLLSLFFFLCFGLWASGALLIYNIVFWCPDPGHFLYIWERLSLKIGICYILKIFLDRLGKFSGTLYWNFLSITDGWIYLITVLYRKCFLVKLRLGTYIYMPNFSYCYCFLVSRDTVARLYRVVVSIILIICLYKRLNCL